MYLLWEFGQKSSDLDPAEKKHCIYVQNIMPGQVDWAKFLSSEKFSAVWYIVLLKIIHIHIVHACTCILHACTCTLDSTASSMVEYASTMVELECLGEEAEEGALVEEWEGGGGEG